MLTKVQVQPQSLKNYKGLVDDGLLTEIETLSRSLKNLKVNMVNATPRGGGVAELLCSLIPLLQNAGIDASWFTIPPKPEFFEVTKNIHNALQSKAWDFPFSARKIYLDHMEETASLMRDMKADIWVIHDPQPAGVVLYLDLRPAVLRIHIDLTDPNMAVWNFIAGFTTSYSRAVVSSPEFVRPEIEAKTIVFTPAIDPLSAKNQPMDINEAREIIKKAGIDPVRPLIAQVSRFDPWKDPLGVIEAYKIAKKRVANLQLAMVGFMEAQDDPEAARINKIVKQAAAKEKSIFILSDPSILGEMKISIFTNAVQVAADVVLQNSVKEGFGLVVTEAMWKGKAVIGGTAAGMKTQIKNGENGFLAQSPQEISEHILRLLEDDKLRNEIGRRAKESVQNNFLMPRLLRDYLKMFNGLLSAPSAVPAKVAEAAGEPAVLRRQEDVL